MLFDTESNGLLDTATKIHCTAAIDVDTRERLDWKPGQIGTTVETLDKADVLIGHNIQRHDIPLITKLTGWRPRNGVIIRDTMICARVMYPNVKETDKALVLNGTIPPGKDYQGKHTLAAWGYRLGIHKGDYVQNKSAELMEQGITDPEEILRLVWAEWDEDMHVYMLQDRETNFALWEHLNVDEYPQAPIDLEHRIAFVCDQMEKAGVPFDMGAAARLQAELVKKRDEVEKKLMASFGQWYAPVSPDPVRSVFVPKKDNSKTGYVAGAPMTKLKLVQFNPGSRDHIAKVLKDRGWKPTKLTESGKPQIDEETVSAIVSQYPDLAGLGEYLMLEKRLSQLATGKQAWMQHVKDDGNIHGVINPMGTGTSRASHFNPNLGQVPAVKSPYGHECRSLFYAKPGWKIVGADQQGLELRGLAHYLAPLDGGKYAKTVLEGDPHWVHAVAMDLAEGERDKQNKLHTIVREDGSKRFIYAYIYGCGDEKAGEIVFECLNAAKDAGGEHLYLKFFPDGGGVRALKRVGKTVRNSFASRITGFSALKRKLSDFVAEKGWFPALDGRRIPIRSEHSALNYLIQSAGAIICKRWVCDAFDAMRARFKYDETNPWNGDFVFGLWVHDEIQVWVRDGLEEETKQILCECASKAGEPYGFRVRLDGEAKAGRTWAETH